MRTSFHWLIWIAAGFLISPNVTGQQYDLVFRGGRVMDGTGNPWFSADVAVREARIVAVGPSLAGTADQIIDVDGMIVCPGFIDLHSHMGDAAFNQDGYLWNDKVRRSAPNLVAQGITTAVINPDGGGPPDLSKQREFWDDNGSGPNLILLVGHNTIRRLTLRSDYRRASSPDEIAAMKATLRKGLDAGAWGMSAGLEYTPGIWSTTRELAELCEEIADRHGVFIVHERSSGADPFWWFPSQHSAEQKTTMLENILELIYVSELTGVTTVATHIKVRGQNYWGSSAAMVRAIDEARERGINIYADQYPYNTSGSDGRLVLIPPWFFETLDKDARKDYAASLQTALEDDEIAEKLRLDIAHTIRRRGGPGRISVMESINSDFRGKTIDELSKELRIDPVDVAFRLQTEGDIARRGGVRLRSFSMSEADIEAIAAKSWCATATDANVAISGDGPVHARFYGTFPRKIHRYAIERQIMTIENAIRSSTSLPAQILGLRDRGLVREGFHADLVVFDPETIRDRSTFDDPYAYPDGIAHVLIAGEFVVHNGERTGALPGSVLIPDQDRSPPALSADD